MSEATNQQVVENSYFAELGSALRAASIATPTLIVDQDKLNKNIKVLLSSLPTAMGYRVVAKSLPSPKLIQHIMNLTDTNKLMTFNLPMLIELSRLLPEADQLIGKPLPVQAVRNYFSSPVITVTTARDKVNWLIDTQVRLHQYADLAEELETEMRIVFELDVGLHRGGFQFGDNIIKCMEYIDGHRHLQFAGFMGYEPHVPYFPNPREEISKCWGIYQNCIDAAANIYDQQTMDSLIRNGAGSPTYRYYETTDIVNEVSVGSVLLKPTDFDTEILKPHDPAIFIATPVIKSYEQLPAPGKDKPNPTLSGCYIYGGRWMAEPVYPTHLRYHSWGKSSNQELLVGDPGMSVTPDDFVYLRPTQSEAILLQFGDLAVYSGGKIVDYWPVFPASA